MRWTILWLSAGLAFAQGTKPKPSAAEYDVQIMYGSVDIGAEYMVHSYSNGENMFLAERYLVAEVAFYPLMKEDEVNIDVKLFGLRLNGKTLLPVQDPAQVAASLRYSPYAMQRQSPISGSVGAGPLDIPIGQQGPVPGGPQNRRPAPPRTTESDPGNGVERQRVSAEEVLMQTALPAGPHKGPVAGFVYFPYSGKTSSLKTVELVYGQATLKLK
jgi:hypothetical protein